MSLLCEQGVRCLFLVGETCGGWHGIHRHGLHQEVSGVTRMPPCARHLGILGAHHCIMGFGESTDGQSDHDAKVD